MNKIFGSAVILGIGLMATSAMAGESGTLAGDGGGVANNTVFVNGQGDTVILLNNQQVLTHEAGGQVVYVAGECVGMAVIKADGSPPGGEGYCTWRESEDDAWDVHFNDGAIDNGGTFEIIGGKGRWAGATGTGGTYNYTLNQADRFAYTYSIDYTIP